MEVMALLELQRRRPSEEQNGEHAPEGQPYAACAEGGNHRGRDPPAFALKGRQHRPAYVGRLLQEAAGHELGRSGKRERQIEHEPDRGVRPQEEIRRDGRDEAAEIRGACRGIRFGAQFCEFP